MHGILGIDVAKEEVVVCLEVEGQAPHSGAFPNTLAGFQKLSNWLKKKVQSLHACMEATGEYGEALAQYLYEAGYTVSVVNPAQIHHYAKSQFQRNKTDKLDAALIAHFCRTQTPAPWTPPSAAWRELRALVRHLADLQAMLTQENNRFKAQRHSTVVQTNLKAHIAFLEQQIEQVQRQIQDHIDHHPDLKADHDLLTSIPGIGDLSASKLLAEIPDMRRFDSANQLVAYAGLNPQQHQSGKSASSYTPVSKIGNADLRTVLYFPAMVASRHLPHMVALATRLKAAGKPGMVAIGAIMRKLLVLVYAILKSRQPFDPHFQAQGT